MVLLIKAVNVERPSMLINGRTENLSDIRRTDGRTGFRIEKQRRIEQTRVLATVAMEEHN